MSTYTTGEIAKLCEITVRTVQYYDKQNVIHPSALTEGGRRIYSEEDLQKMRLVCMLRQLGLSLNTIKKIFYEENTEKVISLLLEEQAKKLEAEITERKKQKDKTDSLVQQIKSMPSFTFNNINDIAYSMEKRKQLRRIYVTMIILGITMDLIQIGTIIFWISTGIWIPFVLGIPLVILCGVILTVIYYRNTAYICPNCHTIFRPNLKEFLFCAHTFKTRKLTCTACGQRNFCIETYNEKQKKNDLS